jgi:hypothetical protein
LGQLGLLRETFTFTLVSAAVNICGISAYDFTAFFM